MLSSHQWKALPKEQKEYYEAKARRVMEKHNQEQAEAERRENEAAAAAAAAAAAGHSGDAAATHPSPRTKVNGNAPLLLSYWSLSTHKPPTFMII